MELRAIDALADLSFEELDFLLHQKRGVFSDGADQVDGGRLRAGDLRRR